MQLDERLAARFARTALGHVTREYPNKLDHVMTGDGDARTPRQLHPAFFGSYDWHSCVHGWWTLLTLRRLFPGLPEAAETGALAEEVLTAANLSAELEYARRPESAGFERPYGWAWLLYLHHEAERHDDREWGARLEPLARHFAAAFPAYLERLTYPITVGTHFNTAFALVLAHQWAMHRDAELLLAIEAWAERVFGTRSDYRGWEPGGDEFLSPVLTAALLVSRVRGRADFTPWFEALLLDSGWLDQHCEPVFVSDRSDGKIAHLDGLNLSRAWCLRALACKLAQHPRTDLLDALAERHFAASIDAVDGDYMGSHWLASFALLALLEPR